MKTKADTEARLMERLRENRARRDATIAELEAARHELQQLLGRGRGAGLAVAGMAEAAGVSRETAHKLLREAERPREATGRQKEGRRAG